MEKKTKIQKIREQKKCTQKLCSNGWIFEKNGQFKGRCSCSIREYLLDYLDWSNVHEDHHLFIEELKTYDIYYNADTKKPADYVETINSIIEMRDELLKSGRILLKGDKGTGKTQMASTIGIEIFRRIDWKKEKIELRPFFLVNLKHVMTKSTLFNSDKSNLLYRQIMASKVLIIDEFGDELNAKDGDGHVAKVMEFLKTIADEYKGLIIMTTNDFNVEQKYKEERIDIYSRLLGDVDERDNFLVFGFGFRDKKDLRDEKHKNEKLRAFKDRFKK